MLAGLLILGTGLVPWTVLARLNASLRPDLPWAAAATLLYLAALVSWLHGVGPPSGTGLERRGRLRLRPSSPAGPVSRPALTTGAIVLLLGLLYVAWVLIARSSPVPDLSAFPSTAHRWSLFIMGGVTAGVVEEAAFRGYMQTGLERHDPSNAIWITSGVFVAAHLNQGIGAVLLLGPGLFMASVLYGMLARATGTILPGMAIHVVGDLAHTYFGALRGDGSLLFVS